MKESKVFSPVKKKNEKVVYLIMNEIKDALITGRLTPGDKLPSIAKLAAEMNVGVSSVREAIKMLEALGVLESCHGEGTFICTDLNDDLINPLTFQLMILSKNTNDLIEFRKMFESSYTFMALENATEDEINHIRIVVEKLNKKKTPVDTKDEMEFHKAVLNCSHNKYVIKVGETMLELFLATIQKQPVLPNEYSVYDNHMKIYEALRDKNKHMLHEALEESFVGWKIKYLTEN